jgi:hypothetical protein
MVHNVMFCLFRFLEYTMCCCYRVKYWNVGPLLYFLIYVRQGSTFDSKPTLHVLNSIWYTMWCFVYSDFLEYTMCCCYRVKYWNVGPLLYFLIYVHFIICSAVNLGCFCQSAQCQYIGYLPYLSITKVLSPLSTFLSPFSHLIAFWGTISYHR